MRNVKAIVLAALVLAACDDGDGGSGDGGSSDDGGAGGSGGSAGEGGGEGGGAPPGEVALSVLSATEASRVSATVAEDGWMFAIVTARIANGRADAIAIGSPTFRLRGDDGLEVTDLNVGPLIPDGCPADAFLAAGAQTSCSLGFYLPAAVTPTHLVYAGASDPGGVTPETLHAEAVVPSFDRCTRCGAGCVDTATSREHCGGCDRLVPNGASCVDGEAVCDAGGTRCGDACVDTRSDPAHCGGCDTPVATGQRCVDGEGRCAEDALVCDGACRPIDRFGPCCGGMCASSDNGCAAGRVDYEGAGGCTFSLTIACDELPQETARDPRTGCTGDRVNLSCSCTA